MKQGETSLSDAPSLVDDSGTKNWYKKDTTVLHRIGGPAVERADGMREWWEHGERHRLDGPAIEDAKGNKQWWENGKPHRLGGGPAVEWADGSKYWYKNGKPHRVDGPAIERADGSREWWENDKPHRVDGPAIEHADGSREWWVNGYQIEGIALELFKQAISQTTSSSKLSELSHHENNVVAQGAATNPNCPLEDQVEWALMRGEVLGE